MYTYKHLTPEEREKLVEERIRRGFPPHAPPHPFRGERFYFLTAACYYHQTLLSQPHRRREILREIIPFEIKGAVELRAWVILENHYHLLVRIREYKAVSTLFNMVHGRTSYRWNTEDRRRGRKVWYRYTDRAIRSDRHYYASLNYIHYNPIKHRVARSPYEWQESSVHWYRKYYGRDWLNELWATYPVLDYGKNWDEF